MEDINMNKPKTSTDSPMGDKSLSQENKNKHPPDHAAMFEDLWSSALDDSPPPSQVSSPVHIQNHMYAYNQNHHQRRKKRFKIRMPSDSMPTPRLNHVEQALVNQAIREHLSSSKKNRGSRSHHKAHVNNAQNNAYTLNQQAAVRSNTNTAKSSQSKAQPVCTQSRPEPEASPQVNASSPKEVSSSASTSVQNLPKGDQTHSSVVTPQPQPNPHSTSNDIPQKPAHVSQSTSSPQKAPSEPTLTLPPGFEYMNESQKQLFLEYQQQQQMKQKKQQQVFQQSVSSPRPSNVQHQQYPSSVQQQVPHSQGTPVSQNSNQQPSMLQQTGASHGVHPPSHQRSNRTLETLQHSQEISSAESGKQKHLQQLPSNDYVQPISHNNQQQSNQQSNSLMTQQQHNKPNSSQNTNNEQALHPHVSQPQRPSSVSATSVVEKRKVDSQNEDNVHAKRQKSEDSQPTGKKSI